MNKTFTYRIFPPAGVIMTGRLPLLMLLPAAFLVLLLAGCSGHYEKAVVLPDSTISYPPRITGGISAKITLCRKHYKIADVRIGQGTLFATREDELIHAFVDLENCFLQNDRDLLFHLDWIAPDGRSFYLKQVRLSKNDSTRTLKSSVNISPAKRPPGRYLFRVYLFRELIAEKRFTLLPPGQEPPPNAREITAHITLCRNADKETGDRTGPDSLFFIGDKEKVAACIDLENRHFYGDKVLMFRFDWVGPDGKSFYHKQLDLPPDDTASTLYSAISIAPGKRQPGNYFFRVSLYDEPLAGKWFELRPKMPVVPAPVNGITAKVDLCMNVDKKTGERAGIGTVFTLGEKEKVCACIDLSRSSPGNNKELKLRLDWIGPDGKSFFDKQVTLSPGDTASVIQSTISIPPSKRRPGHYLFRVSLHKHLLAEKKFTLRAP
jgi:hypothetical protein